MTRAAAMVLVLAACADHPESRRIVAAAASDRDRAAAPLVMPPRPPSGAPVVQIAAAEEHACARHADGAVSCWGDNTSGQLGRDASGGLGVDPARRYRDRPVGAPIGDALDVATPAARTCVRRTDGVWCWGGPDPDPRLIADTQGTAEIAGMCGRDGLGAVRCWGGLLAADPEPSLWGSIDLGAYGTRICGVRALGYVVCTVLDGGGQSRVDSAETVSGAVEVAPGGDRTCVRVTDGGVVCWRDGRFYNTDPDGVRPHRIEGVEHATHVVAGASFGCAREASREVRCWGLYPGRPEAAPVTEAAVVVPGVHADELAAGNRFVCARDGGEVWCWGENDHGELGNGWSPVHPAPLEVPGIEDAVDVHAGSEQTCVRRRNGIVTCWGKPWRYGPASAEPLDVASALDAVQLTGRYDLCARFDTGELRCGAGTARFPLVARHVVDAARGELHGAVIDRDGRLYSFGNRRLDRTDEGTDDGTPGFSRGLDAGAVAVAVGDRSTCVVTAAGGVACLGKTPPGPDRLSIEELHVLELGEHLTPIAGVDHATQVAIGADAACAVIADGTVRCWGRGDRGALGRGGSGPSPRAVPIAGLDGVVQVSGQAGAMCARRNDDTVRCWGDNHDGVLGDPVQLPWSADPITVPITGVVDVAVSRHACVVRSTGQVLCWGAAESGQIGTFVASQVFAPTRVDFARR